MRIIRGKYGRRRFDVPSNISARPTTDFARENLFNVLDNFIDFESLSAVDLFAGTGAISIELLSRGCSAVTSVEMAATQYNFLKRVQGILNDQAWNIVRGDARKFIAAARHSVDFVFADPPYSMNGFGEIPQAILSSALVAPGTVFVMEHSKDYDFSNLEGFSEHRAYGAVNFSIFKL